MVSGLLATGYKGFREGHFLSLICELDRFVEKYLKDWIRIKAEAEGIPLKNRSILRINVDKSDLKQRLFNVFRDVQCQLNPESPWLDKTPETPWSEKTGVGMIRGLPIVSALWPDAVFIFAKRRAIENVSSRVKRFPHFSFEHHCIDWAKAMAAWRNVRGQLPQDSMIEIDQFDIARNPQSVAFKLQTFLHLRDDQRDVICHVFKVRRPEESEKGSALRIQSIANWPDDQKQIFQTYCRSECEAFGYSMDDNYFQTA